MRHFGVFAGVAALLICSIAGSAELPDRRSGYTFMSPQTRAMQDDDTTNPAMLSVLEGDALWSSRPSPDGKSCAECHDEVGSMRGVSVRYPAVDNASVQLLTLEARINVCRSTRQNAPAFTRESASLLGLSALIARQSRGLPIAVVTDGAAEPHFERGRALYERRQGQLNLACAQCHDENWHSRLAGNPITQAHPTGYPIYRLEWQSIGSLERRLRNCLTGIRAEPFAAGAIEYAELELFLKWRARGMPSDAPAVRP